MIDKFFKPVTLNEAVELRSKFNRNSLYFAGGTEINSTDHSNEKKQAISIELLGLNKIEKRDQEVIIGSGVTMQQLIDSPQIPETIKRASKYMTNRNIRNMATIGGNIASNKSCSNLIPVLLALGAKLNLLSAEKEESLELYEYIDSNKDSLITHITIPYNKERVTALNRFTRSANDIAILNVAVSFIRDDNKLSDFCVAVGGVSRHVVRLLKLEERLNKSSLPLKEELEAMTEKLVNPIDDIRGSAKFKTYLTGVMVTDSLYSAFNQEEK